MRRPPHRKPLDSPGPGFGSVIVIVASPCLALPSLVRSNRSSFGAYRDNHCILEAFCHKIITALISCSRDLLTKILEKEAHKPRERIPRCVHVITRPVVVEESVRSSLVDVVLV